MEFDINGIMEQFFDMLVEKSFDNILNDSDLNKKDVEIVKKTLKVFADNGVPTLKALKIIDDIKNALEASAEETTDYVCKHCGKKFDKTYPNIESILSYHLETEHADELESSVIEDNFTEE